MRFNSIIILILLFAPIWSSAQIDPPKVEDHGLKMIARATEGKIMLRWAPTSYFTWARCNEVGYQLVRHTVKRDGQLLPLTERSIGTKLTENPIFPLQTEAEWRPLMEKNEYAAIGAQAIFGNSFDVETGTEEAEVSLVNRAADQINRFGFGLFAADHSYEAATAMGLAYVDETAKSNETYLYLVYPSEKPGFTMDTLKTDSASIPVDIVTPIDTGFYTISVNDNYLLPKVLDVKATFEDKTVLLSWNKQLFSQFYVSYIVERSEDGVNWKSIRDRPFIATDRQGGKSDLAYLTDSLEQNNKPYFFRIKGRTAFEEVGPPSDPVQGMGIDPLPSFYPTIISVNLNDQGGFNVGWKFNESDNAKIRGFKVLRGKKDNGPFEELTGGELIPANQRFFIDEGPLATNYYLVVAIDQYQREMSSFAALAQLDDETPPAVPVNLRGTILRNGIMVATWDENTDPDFLGYRVYISNHPNAEFTQLTTRPTPNNHFIDTISLETLTDKYYVKVFSVDYRQNPSEFSEMLELTRPDTIPPTAPVFKDVKSSTEMVSLEWANSSSADIIRHELYRSPLGEENWELIHTLELIDSDVYGTYVDSLGKVGQAYQYKVVAVDNGELQTESKIVQAQIIDNFIRDEVKVVSGTADRRAKAINLNWEYAQEDRVKTFIIFRAKEGEQMRSYKGLSPEESGITQGKGKRKKRKFAFVDKAVNMNTDYQYSIKVIYDDGGQSRLSDPITVNY